jgi:outer membrane protein assembly factor BamD
MRSLRRLVFALGLALGLSGCDLDLSARHATLSYTDDARAAYNQAMEAFKAKEWESAKSLFAEIRKLFSYSRYARLSELRLADIEFEQEKYTEAISAYREFAQNHRNDPDVEYARFRMTRALFLDIDDTIMLPPQEERDQATATEAYKEVRNFLREFPKSRYRTYSLYMLDVVTGRLFRHELYVARYYLKEDNFDAVNVRIDYALKRFPESSLVPEALVLKGETLMKMKKLDEARSVFEIVTKKHGGTFAVPAQRFVQEIDARTGRKPAQRRSDAGPGAPSASPAAAPAPSPAQAPAPASGSTQ